MTYDKTIQKAKLIVLMTSISLICGAILNFMTTQGTIWISAMPVHASAIADSLQLIREDKRTKEYEAPVREWTNRQVHNSTMSIWWDSEWETRGTESMESTKSVEKLKSFWIDEEVAKAMLWPQYKYIDPKYYAVIGLSENARNPWAIWDNWCSNWPYQFNKCSGWWKRAKQIRFWMSFESCSKDYVCATKMLHDKIIWAYKCDVQEDWSIPNWEQCLPRHQGFKYDWRYKDKIRLNHKKVFWY